MDALYGQQHYSAFFGFISGRTHNAVSNIDPSADLSFANVAVDDRMNPNLLQIHLKASKTDPLRSGVNVFVTELGKWALSNQSNDGVPQSMWGLVGSTVLLYETVDIL